MLGSPHPCRLCPPCPCPSTFPKLGDNEHLPVSELMFSSQEKGRVGSPVEGSVRRPPRVGLLRGHFGPICELPVKQDIHHKNSPKIGPFVCPFTCWSYNRQKCTYTEIHIPCQNYYCHHYQLQTTIREQFT